MKRPFFGISMDDRTPEERADLKRIFGQESDRRLALKVQLGLGVVVLGASIGFVLWLANSIGG